MEPTSHPAAAESAAMRERPRENYTIANAIDDAEWLDRIGAEAILSTARGRQTILTLLAAIKANRPLYNALKNGEEIFVLVQHDRCAPAAIASWAVRADEHGCSGEKVNEAFATAQRWGKQLPESTRWPD